MKKTLLTFLIAVLLIGCTSREEEDQTVTANKIHFTSDSKMVPISTIKTGGEYKHFYATKDSWRYATSQNMFHWQSPVEIAIPGNTIGEVLIDMNNVSQTGSIEKPPIIAIYHDDEIKMKYSTDEGISWNDKAINVPVTGNPKLAYDNSNEKWVMIVSGDTKVTLLSSTNLIDWLIITELESPTSSLFTSIAKMGDEWLLISSGETSSFRILDRDFQTVKKGITHTYSSTDILPSLASFEGQSFFFNPLDNRTLGIPKNIFITNGDTPTINFASALNSISQTKKRSKTSSLRSQGSSRFQFQVENVESKLEVMIFNDQGESLKIDFDLDNQLITVDKTKSSNAFKGEKEEISWKPSEDINIDIVIDHSAVELSANEGIIHFGIPTKSVFIYDQVKVLSDGKNLDPPCILYTLAEQTESELSI